MSSEQHRLFISTPLRLHFHLPLIRQNTRHLSAFHPSFCSYMWSSCLQACSEKHVPLNMQLMTFYSHVQKHVCVCYVVIIIVYVMTNVSLCIPCSVSPLLFFFFHKATDVNKNVRAMTTTIDSESCSYIFISTTLVKKDWLSTMFSISQLYFGLTNLIHSISVIHCMHL